MTYNLLKKVLQISFYQTSRKASVVNSDQMADRHMIGHDG